jgi:putative PIN family toxin of toxin-antitoxin system
MKIVLDTNCLVVCLPMTSPYYCLWKAFRDMRITFCYTTDIIYEYNEILERFYHRQFASDIINELLLSPNVIKANNYYRWNLIVADPDDNKFVDCALNVGADYIVTNDKHFNVLKSINFPSIKIINIEAFKKVLML